jgi:putative endonuclease
MSNQSRTLYTGVTNNLERCVFEYKMKLVPGSTNKYHIDKLVFYEMTPDVRSAIMREKQIKGWTSNKKIALRESKNPEWDDLSMGG